MSAFEDVRSGLALSLTSNYVAQSSESKGLQVWTQQLTQSSKLGWCALVFVRISLALMMLTVLMWDNFVYFFGTERLVSALGTSNGNVNGVLLPLCTYLIFGAVMTISMSLGGRGHFKIAHPRMLTAHAMLASIAFPIAMLTFFVYWLIQFPNRTSTVPFLESENGERIVALGHTLGFVASVVDVMFVEQALFLGDVVYPVLFALVHLLILHIGVSGMSEVKIMIQGEVQQCSPSMIVTSDALVAFVAVPFCYVCFWLTARNRGQALLRNSKNKDLRQQMRQRDALAASLLAQPVAGNPFEEGAGNPFDP